MKSRILTLFLFGIISGSVAQNFNHYLADPAAAPRDHSIDISKMVVEVEFEPEKGLVKGIVTHDFKPLRPTIDTLFWDAPEINIQKVVLSEAGSKNWKEIKFETNNKGLITKFSDKPNWDKEYQIRITYTATPRKGIYFIGWNSPEITDSKNQTRRQIWTQGQGIDHRHWIPMYDNMNDKFITETKVKFDGKYKVLSNGDLKNVKDQKDGVKLWHYCLEKPHAGYLLMLAIDKYGIKKTKTSRGTPVQFWYYPEHQEKVELTSMHTEKIIEFLEDETGYAYPWGSYSQVMVQDFMYGAMENTSATIFGDFFNVDTNSFNDRNYISVNAHELTHQWFGDLVTARSRRGTWLQESFATYYAKLFMKQIYGDQHYEWALRGEVNSALRASRKDNYPVAHTKGGTTRVYPKGSAVLHMLRYVLGNQEYLRVIDHYVDKHAFGNIETNDLIQACEDVLGREMRWFFDQWVYRGGEPHYTVNSHSNSDNTTFIIEQIHQKDFTVGNFKMPVKIGIYFKNGKSIEETRWIEKSTESVQLNHTGYGEIDYALFDVGSNIMKKLTMNKSKTALLSQFSKARHMIDRYDALIALKSMNQDRIIIDALKEQYKKESFWAIKAEIVRQLMNKTDLVPWVKTALSKEDVRIRRVVLSEVKEVAPYKDFFMESLNDKSYRNIETAMRRLVKNEPQVLPIVSDLTKQIIGNNHSARIAWLELNIQYGAKRLDYEKTPIPSGIKQSPAPLDSKISELEALTSNLYEFRTRTAAMNVVKRINSPSDKCLTYIMDASISPNSRLAGPAKSILKYFKQQHEISAKMSQVYNQDIWDESQKKLLKNTGLF